MLPPKPKWLPLLVPYFLASCASSSGNCSAVQDPVARDSCFRDATTTSTVQGAAIGAGIGGLLGAGAGALLGKGKTVLPAAAGGAVVGGAIGGLYGNTQGQTAQVNAYREDNEKLRAMVVNAEQTSEERLQQVDLLQQELAATTADKEAADSNLARLRRELAIQLQLKQDHLSEIALLSRANSSQAAEFQQRLQIVTVTDDATIRKLTALVTFWRTRSSNPDRVPDTGV